MNSNIFIPKKLNIGFQERSDTYTQKLAYVIYYDQKGKLRKEKSWQSWRDSKIEPLILDNEPTSGFVINKKAGGYDTGWNHRNTYVRIYDPRDFEFEVSVANLLYILENTNSIKGKGLEGDFVYGWEGTELVLIPTSSTDYKKMQEFSNILQERKTIKGKDLKIGATYKTKTNESRVYMGRFDKYDYDGKNIKKHYWFYEPNERWDLFYPIKSVGEKIISIESDECIENYAEIFEKMEAEREYSPVSKSKYIPYSFDEFSEESKARYWTNMFTFNGFRLELYREKDEDLVSIRKMDKRNYNYTILDTFQGGLEEAFNKFSPCYKETYLANGKLNSTSK